MPYDEEIGRRGNPVYRFKLSKRHELDDSVTELNVEMISWTDTEELRAERDAAFQEVIDALSGVEYFAREIDQVGTKEWTAVQRVMVSPDESPGESPGELPDESV
jgi:hypothetical protein